MVRIYGKAGLLFGLMTAFMRIMAGAFGVAMPASSQERVIEAAERDAQRMVMRGYRVVASDWFEMRHGLGYQKVVYELDPEAQVTSPHG